MALPLVAIPKQMDSLSSTNLSVCLGLGNLLQRSLSAAQNNQNVEEKKVETGDGMGRNDCHRAAGSYKQVPRVNCRIDKAIVASLKKTLDFLAAN